MVAVLIVLAVLLLLLLLRIGLTVQYGEEGPLAAARIGPVTVPLYPRREREKRRAEKPKPAPPAEGERGAPLERVKAGLSLVKPVLSRVRRRLLIRELTVRYTAAAEDAAKAAIAYGSAHGAVAALLPLITYNFRVKEQNIQIQVDFQSEESRVFLRVRLSMAVWEVVYLAVSVGGLLLKSGLLRKKAPPVKTGRTPPEETEQMPQE